MGYIRLTLAFLIVFIFAGYQNPAYSFHAAGEKITSCENCIFDHCCNDGNPCNTRKQINKCGNRYCVGTCNPISCLEITANCDDVFDICQSSFQSRAPKGICNGKSSGGKGGKNDKDKDHCHDEQGNEAPCMGGKGGGGSSGKNNKCEKKCIKRCCKSFDCRDEDTLLDVQISCSGDACKTECKSGSDSSDEDKGGKKQKKCEKKCLNRCCANQFDCKDPIAKESARFLCEGSNCDDACRGGVSSEDEEDSQKQCEDDCLNRCCASQFNCEDDVTGVATAAAKLLCSDSNCSEACRDGAAVSEEEEEEEITEESECNDDCILRCCSLPDVDCGTEVGLETAALTCVSLGCEDACKDSSAITSEEEDDEEEEGEKPVIKNQSKCEKQCLRRCCKDEFRCGSKEARLAIQGVICSGENCVGACTGGGEISSQVDESEIGLEEEDPELDKCEQDCVNRCCEDGNCNAIEAAVECLGENCETGCTVPVIFDVEEEVEEANQECQNACVNRCCINLDCDGNEGHKQAAENTCAQDCNASCPVLGTNQCEQDCVTRCCATQDGDCSNTAIQEGFLGAFCQGNACETGCGGTSSSTEDTSCNLQTLWSPILGKFQGVVCPLPAEETTGESDKDKDERKKQLRCTKDCVKRCCAGPFSCVVEEAQEVLPGFLDEWSTREVNNLCRLENCETACIGGASSEKAEKGIRKDALVKGLENNIEFLNRDIKDFAAALSETSSIFTENERGLLDVFFIKPAEELKKVIATEKSPKKCTKAIKSKYDRMKHNYEVFDRTFTDYQTETFVNGGIPFVRETTCHANQAIDGTVLGKVDCFPFGVLLEHKPELNNAINHFSWTLFLDNNDNGIPDICE